MAIVGGLLLLIGQPVAGQDTVRPPAQQQPSRTDTARTGAPVNRTRRLPAFDSSFPRPKPPVRRRVQPQSPNAGTGQATPAPSKQPATTPQAGQQPAAGGGLSDTVDRAGVPTDTLGPDSLRDTTPPPPVTTPLPPNPKVLPIAVDSFVRFGAWRDWQPLISLNQPWVLANGDTVRIPWVQHGFQRQFDVRTRLFLPDSVALGNVVLRFEALPGINAVYWDDALIDVYETRNKPLTVQLNAKQLARGWHTLRVVQQAGRRSFRTGEQQPLLGIPAPVWFVVPDGRAVPNPPYVAKAQHAIQYALASSNGGLANPAQFAADLTGLLAQLVRTLHFATPPPAVYQAMLSANGFQWTDRADSLALFQCAEASRSGNTLPCWTARDGGRTSEWGMFAAADRMRIKALRQLDALLLLLPGLLVLVVWRLLDVSSYRALLRLGAPTGERKRYEQARGQQLLRGSSLLLASLGHFLLLATALTLAILFLRYHELLLPYAHTAWGYPLLALLAQLHQPPLVLGMVLLGLVAASALLRYSIGVLLAGFYRRRYFLPRLLGIEAYAAYPWLLIPALCGFALVALPAGESPLASIALIISWLIWYIIRTLRLGIGLARVLDFHWVAIVLYICAVEILPLLAAALAVA